MCLMRKGFLDTAKPSENRSIDNTLITTIIVLYVLISLNLFYLP